MTQVDPAPQPPQQPQPLTEADLWTKICAQASDLLERPKDKPLVFGRDFSIGHVFIFWKGEPQPDGSIPPKGVTIYERGEPAPLKTSLSIMAIFGFADDFVRVYCVPMRPDARKPDLGPARITLSRTAPVPSAYLEYIAMGQFISEIASEIVNDLGGIPGGDEDEDEDEDEEDEEEEDGHFTPT